MGFHSQHSVNATVNTTVNTAKTLEKPQFSTFSSKKATILHFVFKDVEIPRNAVICNVFVVLTVVLAVVLTEC